MCVGLQTILIEYFRSYPLYVQANFAVEKELIINGIIFTDGILNGTCFGTMITRKKILLLCHNNSRNRPLRVLVLKQIYNFSDLLSLNDRMYQNVGLHNFNSLLLLVTIRHYTSISATDKGSSHQIQKHANKHWVDFLSVFRGFPDYNVLANCHSA
jgi:hypothetical protein